MSVNGPGSEFCAVVGSSISVFNVRFLLQQCYTESTKGGVPWKKSLEEPAAAEKEASIAVLLTIHGTYLCSLIIT